jgi:hypothetical protein
MDALGANAFASTQANAARGRGNANPRRAFMRKPAVALSREGFNWLNEALEVAFQAHGKLTPTELERLDWPDVSMD